MRSRRATTPSPRAISSPPQQPERCTVDLHAFTYSLRLINLNKQPENKTKYMSAYGRIKSSPQASAMQSKLVLFLLFISIKRLECEFATGPQTIDDVVLPKGADEIVSCKPQLAVNPSEPVKSNSAKYKLAQRLKELVINNFTSVEWLKNGEPFHRENGNFFLPRADLSKFERVMHNVDCSDEAQYTCKYTYNISNSNKINPHDYLVFVTEQLFTLKVDDRQLVESPVITRPPHDQFVHRGSNVTFTCKHLETVEGQEYEWFFLHTSNFTGSQVAQFLAAFNQTAVTNNVSHIAPYKIEMFQKQDSLTLDNVTDLDLGFYGCYVILVSGKALDIRFGRLNFVENILPSMSASQHHTIQWTYVIMMAGMFVFVLLVFVLIHNIKLGFPKREKIVCAEHTSKPQHPHYDTPPSTGPAHYNCSFLKSSCVINPIYGLAQPLDSNDWYHFPKRNVNEQEIIFIDKLGEGQFGEVHRCIARYKDGSEKQVAVKMLRSLLGVDTLSYLGSDRDRKDLMAEIEIMKLLTDHPYVVRMIDYFVNDGEPILLMMELVKNGKLQTYLRDSRTYLKSTNELDSYITSRDLIKFSYQVAKGMEYVASQGIIHRDLASRNILITEDRICKVADFGFARRITDECAYERTNGDKVPVRWMAPEALLENKFTSKSDVFSFGILVWEIVTLGSTPYESLSSVQVLEKVKLGGRLDKPHHCKAELFDVMVKCWSHNPRDRPTFSELAVELEKMLMSENDYIELNQYPNHAYYNILTDKSDEKL